MKRRKSIVIWLWIGVLMVFMQILLGGITRLTGSGLSITKWDIVTGTIPPLNAEDWEEEFNLYRQTPQYRQINVGMTLPEFKFIYFWEYLHRLWARLIGFVFFIPFTVFVFKNWIDRKLYKQLGIAVLLGGIVAAFGWIMVASGLINRPWVNAYKLTIHLNLAMLLYAWLLWIALGDHHTEHRNRKLKWFLNITAVLVIIQFILGGLMSGMKAGLYYPTWPDMHGEFLPKVLMDNEIWTIDQIIRYESGLMPGLVQFSHRMFAYFIFLFGTIMIWYAFYRQSIRKVKSTCMWFYVVILMQVSLGILTVMNSIGKVPLVYGVAHQAVAILLVSIMIYLHRIIHK